MHQIRFYAEGGDLDSVLDRVEAQEPIVYVQMGSSAMPMFPVFNSRRLLPDLGTADQPSGATCRAFLVSTERATLQHRVVHAPDMSPRYCMDQLLNPDSVVLRPAGLWEGRIVLSGYIGSATQSDVARRLLRRFSKVFRESFVHIGAYFVGPNAARRLENGGRLAIAAASPSEYDLRQ